MKNQRRIIYFLRPWDFPAGGVATIYQHVEILAQNGYQAFVALSHKPNIDFYNSNAPLMIHGGKIEFKKGDIYVFPEQFIDYMEALKYAQARKIMFCQNQYYLPFSTNSKLGFKEFPVDSLLVSSKSIGNFMRDVYGLIDVPCIPYAIDRNFYISKKKKRQIAFMPRKLPNDAAFIENTFKRKYKELSDIPWVSIDGMTKLEAANVMGESEVFLSLSYKDSFGLPPLEAMSCGCLVAGFHGDGGREYMNSHNGWWAETGDWLACINGLNQAFTVIDCGGAELEKIKLGMENTLTRYSFDNMKNKLLEYWDREISSTYT